MNKHVQRALLWALVLGIMAAIFLFSSQNSAETMATSGWIAVPLARWIAGFMTNVPFVQILDVTQLVVRKLGHFTEYTALGCALRWLMLSYGLAHTQRWAWLSGTIYACTDELHQLLGGERTGMWQDVVLDSLGVLTGTLAAMLLISLWRRRWNKSCCQSEET